MSVGYVSIKLQTICYECDIETLTKVLHLNILLVFNKLKPDSTSRNRFLEKFNSATNQKIA